MENATGFVRDFGLMGSLIDGLGLDEAGRRLFVLKLGMIHQTMVRKHSREAGEAAMGKS